jgi:sec-independent protein translocase protein TatA
MLTERDFFPLRPRIVANLGYAAQAASGRQVGSGHPGTPAPIEGSTPMFGLGAPELLIVLAVVLVLFGGSKLPQLARSLGEAKREFETSHSEQSAADKAA